MATLNVLFAFTNVSDFTAWTFNNGGGQVASHSTTQGSPTLGSVEVILAGKNNNALSGDFTRTMTFEQLGVPSNATITAITNASMRTYTRSFVTATSLQYAAYITPSGFSQITLSALREPVAADGGWVTTTGAGATGLSIPSATSCELMMDIGQRTGNSNSAEIISNLDTLTFDIVYDVPGNNFTETPVDTATVTEELSFNLQGATNPRPFFQFMMG